MRHEGSVTSISWIPSEAMTGPMRVPMDLGIGHYDQAPPDHVEKSDLEELRQADRFRFANHLAAWIETDGESIVDAGYVGGGYVGSTTAKLGLAVTFPGVSFPVLHEMPATTDGKAIFRQTVGGRTGAPMPHRIDRPPYIRMTAPTAWTTLQLTIYLDGSSDFEMVGASPFPRHWIYDAEGDITAKSGLIDYTEWTRVNDHTHTPWHDFERSVLMSDVESQIERQLSSVVMGNKHELIDLTEGEILIEQGEPGGIISLILDGLLIVEVDGVQVAELGPGAIVGERAILEGGFATATVKTVTQVKAASIPSDLFDREDLEQVATHHHGESV